jgi:hypothetical protein
MSIHEAGLRAAVPPPAPTSGTGAAGTCQLLTSDTRQHIGWTHSHHLGAVHDIRQLLHLATAESPAYFMRPSTSALRHACRPTCGRRTELQSWQSCNCSLRCSLDSVQTSAKRKLPNHVHGLAETGLHGVNTSSQRTPPTIQPCRPPACTQQRLKDCNHVSAFTPDPCRSTGRRPLTASC